MVYNTHALTPERKNRMKISTFASPQAIVEEGLTIKQRFVIVIDTLRATSVITAALSRGAKGVIPVMEIEEAVRLYQNLDKERTLLCGERGGNPIPGFHLGNSAIEYTPAVVAGKTLIMTTTNGTRAIHAAGQARALALGCLLNASAVAADARRSGLDVTILCAGTRGRFTLEDILTAGAIVERLGSHRMNGRAGAEDPGQPDAEMDDLSMLSHDLYLRHYGDLRGALRQCTHARYLAEAGYSQDIDYCMQADLLNAVPYYEKGLVMLER